jgi:HEPN domain-containing protein
LSAELLVATHLRLAAEALNAANLLFEAGNRNAAYLAEQAVEQLVLALAQSEGIHYSRGQQHQLDTMIRALPDANTFKASVHALSWLEAYATAFRYPRTKGGLTASPPAEKLNGALSAVTPLLSRLALHYGVELDAKADQPALHVRAPRATAGAATVIDKAK